MNTNGSTSTRAWVAFLIVSAFYFFQYIFRVFPSIAMPSVMERFHINAALFGQFSGFYYIGYCLVHIPIGLFLDRFGPKKVLPICLGLIAVGMLPLAVSDFWLYALLGRMCVGAGSSGAILGVFKVLHAYFPKERFTQLLSVAVIIGLMGAIYGGGPTYLMLTYLGFEQLVLLLVAIALCLGGLAFWLTPHMPTHEQVQGPVVQELRLVLLNWKMLALCFFSGLMVGPLEGFGDAWGKEFFKNVYGFSDVQSASLPSFIFFGMCFGGPVLSWIAERRKQHLLVLIGCAAGMLGGFGYILSGVSSSIPILSAILFGIGMLSAYQILAIFFASTFVSHALAGLASAVANMIIMLFGYLFHVAIGQVVYLTTLEAGVEQGLYTGVMVIPTGLLFAMLGLIWFYWHYQKSSLSIRSE